MTAPPPDLACCLCGWTTTNPMLLLWDADTDQRYCANHPACQERRTGQPEAACAPRCDEKPCILDPAHGPTHQDAEGRQWEAA